MEQNPKRVIIMTLLFTATLLIFFSCTKDHTRSVAKEMWDINLFAKPVLTISDGSRILTNHDVLKSLSQTFSREQLIKVEPIIQKIFEGIINQNKEQVLTALTAFNTYAWNCGYADCTKFCNYRNPVKNAFCMLECESKDVPPHKGR